MSAYRVVDHPDPLADFATPEGREKLRRDMLVLKVDSIFGPISFDENQRNNGRDAAGTQWLPTNSDKHLNSTNATDTVEEHFLETRSFENMLVAPFLQAEAAAVIPAESARNCPSGYFINETSRMEEGSILKSGCEPCPVNTFRPQPSQSFQCNACPEGSDTNGLTGQDVCFAIDDNLLPNGILIFGYVAVSITWILSLSFMSWIWYHQNDPVVKMSQKEFLVLICIGAMISSSTIIALSYQAGSSDDESTQQASVGCTAAPFLYSIGWALQYSSLSAKTYRLYAVMRNNRRLKRVKVTFTKMLRIVFVVLAIDLAILIPWTVVSPLVYERSEENVIVNSDEGVVTVESVGSCVMEDATVSFWVFAGPIIALHFILLIGTNCLLYYVRGVSDRYQEQKYIAMASILMFEILIVGIPVLVAVNDSPVASHIVFIGIIALSDIGILCFTFIPKIFYQLAGLEEGVTFGESIMRESYQRASTREFARRDSRIMSQMSPGSSEFDASARSTQIQLDSRSSLDSSWTTDDLASRDNTSKKYKVSESIVEENSEDLKMEESMRLSSKELRLDDQQTPQQRLDSSDMTNSEVIVGDDYSIDQEVKIAGKVMKAADRMTAHQRMVLLAAKQKVECEQRLGDEEKANDTADGGGDNGETSTTKDEEEIDTVRDNSRSSQFTDVTEDESNGYPEGDSNVEKKSKVVNAKDDEGEDDAVVEHAPPETKTM
jgi:hypothetical protein